MKFANNNNKRSEGEGEKDKSPAPLPQIKLVAKKTDAEDARTPLLSLAFGAKLNFASARAREKKERKPGGSNPTWLTNWPKRRSLRDRSAAF